MNKKGQALVEFVLILPILIMILFAVIDLSNIYYNKNHIEGILDDTVSYVENGLSKDEISNIIGKDYDINISIKNNYATIEISKNVSLITPFSGSIFSNPYLVSSSRTIIYE